jgi:hypothetical protein
VIDIESVHPRDYLAVVLAGPAASLAAGLVAAGLAMAVPGGPVDWSFKLLALVGALDGLGSLVPRGGTAAGRPASDGRLALRAWRLRGVPRVPAAADAPDRALATSFPPPGAEG